VNRERAAVSGAVVVACRAALALARSLWRCSAVRHSSPQAPSQGHVQSPSGRAFLAPSFVPHPDLPCSLSLIPSPANHGHSSQPPHRTAQTRQRERLLSSCLSTIKHRTTNLLFPITSPTSPARHPPPSARLRTEPSHKAWHKLRLATRGVLQLLFAHAGNSLRLRIDPFHLLLSPPESTARCPSSSACCHHHTKPTITASPPAVDSLFSRTQPHVATIASLDPMSSLRDGGTSGWEDAARRRDSERFTMFHPQPYMAIPAAASPQRDDPTASCRKSRIHILTSTYEQKIKKHDLSRIIYVLSRDISRL
jgi:hypothetical protein